MIPVSTTGGDRIIRRRKRSGISGSELSLPTKHSRGLGGQRSPYMGVQSTRSRRMFSSGVPHIAEDTSDAGSREEKSDMDVGVNEQRNGSVRPFLSREPHIVTRSGEEVNVSSSEESTVDNGEHDITGTRDQMTDPRKEASSASTLFPNTVGRNLGPEKVHRSMALNMTSRSEKEIEEEKKARTVGNEESRDRVEIPAVKEFLTALAVETKSNQHIFKLYREMPSPGVANLSSNSCKLLLQKFSKAPKRRRIDAKRYVAILEDMIAAGIPASRPFWTSAIHMTGRCNSGNSAPHKPVRRDELEAAIGVWRRMERFAGIKADEVVFEVLFDLAIKARRYTVAERLVKEMKSRGLEFSRFGKVSYISYQGALGDLDGVSKAFTEFVTSGEFVDTVVLNCLLSSLLRAGGIRTAEMLYEGMLEARRNAQASRNDLDEQHMPNDPALATEFAAYRNFTKRLGRQLERSALTDEKSEYHRLLQKSLPLTPDTRTFHIMLSHYARRVGNLSGLIKTLKRMIEFYEVPPRGLVYVLLTEGFFRFGEEKKNEWSAERLHECWQYCFQDLIDSQIRLKEDFNHRLSERRSIKRKKVPKKGDSATPTELNDDIPSEEEPETEQETSENADPSDSNDEADTDWLWEGYRNPYYFLEEALEIDKAEMEGMLENGFFLGPRMIHNIIRAFARCCSTDDLIEVWLQIESIWEPHKRKLSDVFTVREDFRRLVAEKQR